jgi:hypothetical protein
VFTYDHVFLRDGTIAILILTLIGAELEPGAAGAPGDRTSNAETMAGLEVRFEVGKIPPLNLGQCRLPKG